MTRLGRITSLAAAFAVAVGAAGCGDSDTGNRAEGGRPAQKIAAGVVGTLPAPPSRRSSGPRLVLPKPALTVPGRFPIDRLVVFRVPVRNDGTRDLRITKIDPG